MERKGSKADAISYNMLIGACARCDKAQHGLALLQRVKRNDVVPTLVNYILVVNSFVRTGDLTPFVERLREMRESGVAPDHITLHTIMKTSTSKGG